MYICTHLLTGFYLIKNKLSLLTANNNLKLFVKISLIIAILKCTGFK